MAKGVKHEYPFYARLLRRDVDGVLESLNSYPVQGRSFLFNPGPHKYHTCTSCKGCQWVKECGMEARQKEPIR